MDIQLNFLRYKPTTNWFDYFLKRKTFLDLLNKGPLDRPLIISLCDQFIEQALSNNNLMLNGRRQMETEDIVCIRHKIDDLWMCALSCFASCDWDLSLLTKHSNILRVWALLNQLIRWTFGSDQLDQQQSHLLAGDPFGYVSSLSTFDRSNVFFGWLYARWILSVDLEGRFPLIPTRPTVSNPYFTVDQNLIQAERLAQTAMEIRSRMGEAIIFLRRLVDSEHAFGGGEVDVPVKNCFFPRLEIVSKESSVSLLSKFPKPNFRCGTTSLSWHSLCQRTLFDLAVAHFSSKHFKMAEYFLSRIKDENVGKNFENLLRINANELRGYKLALGMDESKVNQQRLSIKNSNVHLNFAKTTVPNPFVHLMSSGNCRISLQKMVQISENVVARRKLIEEFVTEIMRTHTARHPSVLAVQNARLNGSLYFLCALSQGFADSLHNHLKSLQTELKCFSKRGLASLPNVQIPQFPSEECLRELTSSGPSLWTIVTCLDFNHILDAFSKIDPKYRINDQKMIFSTILGEPILHRSSSSGDRYFIQNQIMLWKLEQLARLGDIAKWKELLNKFVEDCKLVKENANLQSLFVYDTVRIELINWGREFCRFNDLSESAKRATSIQGLLNSTVNIALQTKNFVFQRFGLELAYYLINNRQWRFASERIKGQQLFKTGFTDVAVILDVYLSKLHDERKTDEAEKVLRDVFWKVISPTFDEIRTGIEIRTALLSKHHLLEFLQGIKIIPFRDPDVLNVFFGMSAFLFNYALTNSPSTIMDTTFGDDPFQQMQAAGAHLVRTVDQHIFVENSDLWTSVRMDEYRTRPLDMPFTKQVLATLCQQAQLVGPVQISWLRIRADVAFVCEQYEEAIRLYLEMFMALQRGLAATVNAGDGVAEEQCEQFDMDLVYARLAVSLHCLRMPTLAAIIGQMRARIGPHLELVDSLLRNTPITVDAGPAYFPLISDIHLMEKMAAAYEKFDLPLYLQSLLKQMPTRAINVNNSPVILHRENARRRQRFMEIMFKHFFDEQCSIA